MSYSYRNNKRKTIESRNKSYSKNKENDQNKIKASVKIIENRNKIHYFVSDIEIFNFYFNFIEFFLSLYPVLVIHY